MTSMFALWAGTLLALGGSVTEVTITPMESQTNILVVTGELVEYRSFVMEGPHRLVIDLMGATHALPRTEFSAVNRGGISNAVQSVRGRRRSTRLRVGADSRL